MDISEAGKQFGFLLQPTSLLLTANVKNLRIRIVRDLIKQELINHSFNNY
jgi:hypothetical protein